jgi:hypothetical protein
MLKIWQFGAMFRMKNPLYRLKSYFATENLTTKSLRDGLSGFFFFWICDVAEVVIIQKNI